MKTPSGARLADYVKPRLGEARIGRMWAVVARAQQPASTHRFERWALIGALAAATCVALVLWIRPWNVASRSRGARSVEGGDTFATDSNQRQVTLPDGSVLSMGLSTRIEVVQLGAGDVRLRLLRGVLTCDVPHIEGRHFVVEAGSAEVTVKGTRFTVELQPEAATSPALSVSVERGRVQLRLDGRTVAATLDSGQQWTSRKPAVPASSGEPTESAESEVPPPSAAPTTLTPVAGSPATVGAKELMERANTARLEGKPADAAREYARLRERFPGDVRAGLAAFELGRIRLTSLGDARGALDAFHFALAHQRGGFFAEDAEAGAVEALDRLGDANACLKARDAFLERHAQSAHASRIRLLCKNR